MQKLSILTILAVLGTGILVGFNPCALAILVLLAASILSTEGKRRELLTMVAFFSLGIFAMYFFFGLGMQRLLHFEAMATSFRYAVTVLLLVAGLSQVLDAMRLQQGKPSLFRTDWALKYFQAGVERRSIGAYFLIGALFSLVKAPCVGGVYLAILDRISAGSYLEGATYLFFYNLGVVLPILVLGQFLSPGDEPGAGGQFPQGSSGGNEADHRPDVAGTGAAHLLAADLIMVGSELIASDQSPL